MNRSIYLFVTLALFALSMSSMVNAHWVQGYTVDLVSTDTITKNDFDTYTTIGIAFTGLLAVQDPGKNLGQITFAYGASSYIDDVRNCYAVSNTNNTQVTLPNVEYTQISYNDSSLSNYTIFFNVTEEVINVTIGSISTVYCDIKFTAFPTSSAEGYYDGCFSVDIYEENSENIPNHGYSGYVPRSAYDYRHCLQFNGSDVLNTARNTIFEDIFAYQSYQVVTFSIDDIPTKATCHSILSTMKQFNTDLSEFIQDNSNTAATVTTFIQTCSPMTTTVDSYQLITLQNNSETYTAIVSIKVSTTDSTDDLSAVIDNYVVSRNSDDILGFSVIVDASTVNESPACSDGKQNGDETDVDCGGSICATQKCSKSQACLVDSDCSSYNCQSGLCSNGAFATSTLSFIAIIGFVMFHCLFMS